MFGQSSQNVNKPICQFYQRGNCKYGNNCFNLHPGSGTTATNVFGVTSSSNQGYGSFDKSNAMQDNQFLEFVKQVITEMKMWETNGLWQLSCLAPLKEHPPIAEFTDTAPEELRVEAYEALKANNSAAYQTSFNSKFEYQKQLRQSLKNRYPSAIEALKNVYYKTSSSVVTPSANSASLFGKSSGSFLGNSSSQNSLFGGNSVGNKTTSVFGGAPNIGANNIFGTKPQASVFGAAPAFGSSSFGGSSTFKSFGGNQSSSLFGGSTNKEQNQNIFSSQQNQGLFGVPSSASTGIFGTNTSTSGPSNIFGSNTSTSDSNSIFGNSTSISGSNNIFGTNASTGVSNSLFGTNTNTSGSNGIFGSNPSTSGSNGIFGTNTSTNGSTGIFGANANVNGSSNIFGSNINTSGSNNIFGSNTNTTGSSIFGSNTNTSGSNSIFGSNTNTSGSNNNFGTNTSTSGSNSIFATNTNTSGSSLFNANANINGSSGLFSTNTNINGSGIFNTNNITNANASNPNSSNVLVAGHQNLATTNGFDGGGSTQQGFAAPAFGSQNVFNKSQGNSNVFGEGTNPSSQSSLLGNPPQTNLFGEGTNPSSQSSLLGNPPQTNLFGNMFGSGSVDQTSNSGGVFGNNFGTNEQKQQIVPTSSIFGSNFENKSGVFGTQIFDKNTPNDEKGTSASENSNTNILANVDQTTLSGNKNATNPNSVSIFTIKSTPEGDSKPSNNSNLFGINTSNVSSTENLSDLIYTPMHLLSIEDKNEFERDVFLRIPLIPPPKELCF